MTPSRKPAGRPRDMAAAAAIKDAALRLIQQRGYHKVSIAMIVAEAGVARQTLYNNWNTKADLVLDAVFEEAGRNVACPGFGRAQQLC